MWAAFLADILATTGDTQQDFARAIGVTPATISRWLNAARRHPGPGVEVCLRIAALTRTSGSRVLHAAGKGDIAALIEQLYGGPALVRTTEPALSSAERRGLARLRALDPQTRRAFLLVLDHMKNGPK
jgi:transcriptional regulator with XRE-family HTH domain